jgi:hypothetical protein
MKIKSLLFLCLCLCSLFWACHKEENPPEEEEVLIFSDVIYGQWQFSSYRGFPEPPFDQWHPAEDSSQIIHFMQDGNLTYTYPKTGRVDNGTFEIIDSMNTLIISLEPELPFRFEISEFSNTKFIRSFVTDEGPVDIEYTRYY